MWIKIITVLLFVGALIGGVWFLDDRNEVKFARAEDLRNTKVLLADSLKQVNRNINKTNIRIQQYSLQDQVVYTKRKMQELVIECKTTNAYQMPPHARDRYNDLKLQLEVLDREMKRLSNEMGKQ